MHKRLDHALVWAHRLTFLHIIPKISFVYVCVCLCSCSGSDSPSPCSLYLRVECHRGWRQMVCTGKKLPFWMWHTSLRASIIQLGRGLQCLLHSSRQVAEKQGFWSSQLKSSCYTFKTKPISFLQADSNKLGLHVRCRGRLVRMNDCEKNPCTPFGRAHSLCCVCCFGHPRLCMAALQRRPSVRFCSSASRCC